VSEHDRTMQAIQRMVSGCSTVLAGHQPEHQGAAVAELLAMYLRGHVSTDLQVQQALRLELFTAWCDLVRELVGLPPQRKPH